LVGKESATGQCRQEAEVLLLLVFGGSPSS
jgi:hypothetical protein